MRAPGVNNIQLNTQVDHELEEGEVGRHLHREEGTKIPPAIHDDMMGENESSQIAVDPYGRSRRSFEELAASKQVSPRNGLPSSNAMGGESGELDRDRSDLGVSQGRSVA